MSVRAYSRDPSNAPENIPHTLYLDMSHFRMGLLNVLQMMHIGRGNSQI